MPRHILNRASAPLDLSNGWIQIVPKGELKNDAGGIVQILDDEALSNIMDSLEADSGDANWPGIYAGREHFIYDPDLDSAALAWFKVFQKRDDGIWAKADGLTPAGEDAVENQEYKFTSFVADRGDLEKIPGEIDGLPCYRVNAIDTVGFTNLPNAAGMLAPITNRNLYHPFKSKGERDAAAEENRNHVEANKAAQAQVAAQRKADTEGEAAELAVPALEKWCRAVKAVLDATKKSGHPLSAADAWTYARQKFPDIYSAAFAPDADDSSSDDDDAADQAGTITKDIANRVSKWTGKGFDFGWNFVREELPQIFNRMNPTRGRVLNRQDRCVTCLTPKNAAMVYNRLARAEMAVNRLPENAAYAKVNRDHPGLAGLASGRWPGSDALRAEPDLVELLS